MTSRLWLCVLGVHTWTRTIGPSTYAMACRHTGYAQVRHQGRLLYVHRVMFERHVGPIPEGAVIDHICHNRGCVNPSHLQAVSSKQNNENRRGATKSSKTGVRGVYYSRRDRKFIGQVTELGRKYHAGSFDSLADAADATSRLRARIFTNSRMDAVDPSVEEDEPTIVRAID